MEAAVHKHRQPERDPLRNPQPVKTAEERRDVDLSTGTEDQPRCSILNRLESVEQLIRQTGKCRTSVVEPRQDKRHHEQLEHYVNQWRSVIGARGGLQFCFTQKS